MTGATRGTRTLDLRFRKPALFPLSYHRTGAGPGTAPGSMAYETIEGTPPLARIVSLSRM